MAIGTKIGGEYPVNWQVVRVGGEQGPEGPSGAEGRKYKSINKFTRTNDKALTRAIITGGSFDLPTPTQTTIDGITQPIVWSDGVPAGEAQLYMTTFVFNDVDHEVPSNSVIWTTPNALTDTATLDIEYSDSLAIPVSPSVNPSIWYNNATVNSRWMAMRRVINGQLTDWEITKIKGEDGAPGAGLNISGRDTIANILIKQPTSLLQVWLASNTDPGAAVPGVINDAYLYVGDGLGDNGTAWDNIGQIVGTDGSAYLLSIVFKRNVGQPAAPTGGTFSSPVPNGWSDGIPPSVDPGNVPDGELVWLSKKYFANPSDPDLADWTAPTVASSTATLSVKYAPRQAGDAEPNDPAASPSSWSDNGDANSYWRAEAPIIDGVVQNSKWVVTKIKGEQGETGDTGIPSFLSNAFIRIPSNADYSNVEVRGGTYVSPVPTSTISFNGTTYSWTDGIPQGEGAIWITSVRFDVTDSSNNKVWGAPALLGSTTETIVRYNNSISRPSGDPVEGSTARGWYPDNGSVDLSLAKWVAMGNRQNGVWPTNWTYLKTTGENGQDGTDARTYIPSTMYVRCDDVNIQSRVPEGGYMVGNVSDGYTLEDTGQNAPKVELGGITYTFLDGIPFRDVNEPSTAGLKIWQIYATFNSVDDIVVGSRKRWSNPTLLQDNNTTDYEYHPYNNDIQPGPPGTPGTSWQSNADGNTFWIAQINYADGPGAVWKVYKIRGEDGKDGEDGADGEDGQDGGSVEWKAFFLNGGPTDPISDPSACIVCSRDISQQNKPFYHSGLAQIPGPGDYVATDDQGTLFDGGYDFFKPMIDLGTSKAATGQVFKISNEGKILEQVSCQICTVSVDSMLINPSGQNDNPCALPSPTPGGNSLELFYDGVVLSGQIPEVGTKLFTDAGLTSPFNGFNKFYKTRYKQQNDPTIDGYGIRISNTGILLSIDFGCNTGGNNNQ